MLTMHGLKGNELTGAVTNGAHNPMDVNGNLKYGTRKPSSMATMTRCTLVAQTNIQNDVGIMTLTDQLGNDLTGKSQAHTSHGETVAWLAETGQTETDLGA